MPAASLDADAVFDALGGLLEVLVTLDAIVLDNPAIGTAWEQYATYKMEYERK